MLVQNVPLGKIARPQAVITADGHHELRPWRLWGQHGEGGGQPSWGLGFAPSALAGLPISVPGMFPLISSDPTVSTTGLLYCLELPGAHAGPT